jgi:ribonuclease D
LDLEADGFHRYPERVALVQLALPSGHLLIVDPVRLTRLDLLGELLGDTHVEVVVHAGAFDLRSMDRDFGFHIRGLFDTAVAAQFCGARRTGLGNVLAEFTGIHLDKPKRYQRLDWSARPLKPGALDYASGDVRYLLALAAELKSRLRELGRLTWVEEECARLETVRYEAPRPPDESWMSIRGARDLSDPSRAVLRELNVFREAEARRSGKPPYRVITNKTMLELAQRRTADVDRLGSANGEGRRRFRERLRQALQRGIDAEPQPWPRRAANGRWSHHARDRLKALKRWRAGEAEVLDLDPGIVWPMDHLKAIAVHEAAASGELDGPESRVRRWQWDNLGPSLERFRREQLGDPV